MPQQANFFDLPDDETLYAAYLRRDAAYDGRAFVGVTSTGIVCRLTCPAKKPKRENCRFFGAATDALDAGFRPCKRCHPLTGHEPVVDELIQALEADPSHRWSEEDLVARGHDPSTVRRAFKRAYGITFLEMARTLRLGAGLTRLQETGSVIDAQLDAGFESASGFRDAVAKLMGDSPASLRADTPLKVSWVKTPLGPMIAAASQTHLHLLEFMDRKGLASELKRLQATTKGGLGFGETPIHAQITGDLTRYFSGDSAAFTTPLAPVGTDFEQRVWQALRTIPAGQTWSYKRLASEIGKPTAMRAVARANGCNQLALIIPCHRVIGADGSLTGYSGGLWRKEKLITLERRYAGL